MKNKLDQIEYKLAQERKEGFFVVGFQLVPRNKNFAGMFLFRALNKSKMFVCMPHQQQKHGGFVLEINIDMEN
jgi:hypothetical protein